MNKKIIRVSDAIPDMPASFDETVERTLAAVCKKQQSAKLRTVETVTEAERKTKPTRWERAKKVMVASVAAVFAVLSLGIGAIVISRGLQNKQHETVQPGDHISETPSEQSSATDAITDHTYRIELCPSFDESTEPVQPDPAQGNKISEKLQNALETTAEESLDLYVWFKDDGVEEAISEEFKAQYPELYNAYMYTEWNEAPQVQTAIETRRQIAAEYYTRTNRERLNANLTDGQILYLGAYGPVCIVSVPTVMVEGLAESDDVVYLDLFENMTSTPSTEGDGVGLSAIRIGITELDVNPGTLQWTTELRLKKNGEAENPFNTLIRVGADEPRCRFYNGDGVQTEDAGAKLVDFASPGSITASEDETDWVLTVPSICALPQLYDAFPGMIPPSGEVTVTQKLFFADPTAESDLPILLGRMEQSFTFDAEKLLNVREPSHIAVPLSGDAVLTVHTGTGYGNEHVSLDGVTLDAEIRYTRTGVFVIVSIKDIGDLSEAQQDALLQAMNNPWDVNECMLICVDGKNDQRMVYHVSRAFWGTTATARFEITVLPEEYASTKTLALDLHAVCVVGEAGGERNRDWHWDSSEGSLPELLTEMQHLASFTVPLADNGSDAITLQPAPAPNSADAAADALCLFVDGDQAYKPFENWVWSDQDDGLAADGMSFLWKIEEVKDKIPTIYNPVELTVRAADGVSLEPQVNVYDAELKTVAFGVDISTVRTLDPGTYYISQRVSRREEGETSGYECVVRVFIGAEQGTGVDWNFVNEYAETITSPIAFVSNGQTVVPYVQIGWVSSPGLEADGFYVGDRMQDEAFRARVPEITYNADDFEIRENVRPGCVTKLEWIDVYAQNGERIAYQTTQDDLNRLDPGTYYVCTSVSVKEGGTTTGYGCAVRVEIGGAVIYSAALSERLQTTPPEAVLSIEFIALDYGNALESAFVYQGKTLTEYRNQPALLAYSEAYETWYYTEYPVVDEQNRNTPGWEKHDPGSLFDAYWRERHTAEEITAYEQASEARKKAWNAFVEWRESDAGKDALQTVLQQECDRLNTLGFSLQVNNQNRIEGTAPVRLLRDFPAKPGYHYWIALVGDTSPIDE